MKTSWCTVYVKAYQIVHFNHMLFIVCQLCLNKNWFKKMAVIKKISARRYPYCVLHSDFLKLRFFSYHNGSGPETGGFLWSLDCSLTTKSLYAIQGNRNVWGPQCWVFVFLSSRQKWKALGVFQSQFSYLIWVTARKVFLFYFIEP